MFENKRLEQIEQKIEVLRMALYGTAYGGGGMSAAILALTEDVDKLKSEAKSDKLLPCPFCGHEPSVTQLQSGKWAIYCSPLNCDIEPKVIYKSKEAAMIMWNRRI